MGQVRASDIIAGSFGFVRDHLKSVIVWSAVYLIIMIGMQFAMRPLMEAQFGAEQLRTGAISLGQFAQLFLILFIAYVAMIAVITVLQAAIFRAALYPERREISYMRLGGDELRLFGLMLILMILFAIGFVIVGIVLAAGVGVIIAIGGAMRVLGILIGVLAWLALFPAMIFFVVRLASAGPLTILRGRITIREAWRLTRGHFWSLFGSYAVVAVVWLVAAGVIFQLSMGSELQQAMMQQMMHPRDPLYQQQVAAMQLEQYSNFGPGRLISLAISAILWSFLIALQCGTIAVATRLLLNDDEPASVF